MKLFNLFLLAVILTSSCKTTRPSSNNVLDNNKILNDSIKSSGVRDSVVYIDSIMNNNKSKYINKPLKVLLDDLLINVKSYSSAPINKVESRGIMISFDDWNTTFKKVERTHGLNNPIRLFIQWQKPISRATVEQQLKRAAGEWGQAEEAFYSELIVGDIR